MNSQNENIVTSRKTRETTTGELLEALRRMTTIEEFTWEYGDDYINMSLVEYLKILLEEKNQKKADIIKKSTLNRIYAYQIFAGVKNPSRDKLITLALAMKLSYEECQRLLRIAVVGELYIKNMRDSIIIFGLINGLEIWELNELLYEMDEFVLE